MRAGSCTRRHKRLVESLEARRLLDGAATLVKDINTNTVTPFSNGSELVFVGSAAYFARTTSAAGSELWKTDGTAAGTILVKDINPGSASSSPAELTAYGGFLFFAADDGVNGRELWRSDGTAAGTVMIANLHDTGSSSPNSFIISGIYLYFVATDETVGQELHRTLGTGPTTQLVSDINPGTASSQTSGLTNINNKLFFTALSAATGREVYTTTGSAATTSMISDLAPGATSGTYANGGRFGNDYYFTDPASDQLFKTDGSAAGTTSVLALPKMADQFTLANGKLLFVEGGPYIDNRKLWSTDGTTAGSTLLKTVTTTNGGILRLTSMGTFALFTIVDPTSHKLELWRTDGSVAGTTLVKTFDVLGRFFSATDYSLRTMPLVNGRVFLAVPTEAGIEPWLSDGTVAGTTLLKDIHPGTGSSMSPDKTDAIYVGGSYYFLGSDELVKGQIYKSDGTAAGTVGLLSADAAPTLDSGPTEMKNINGTLYFSADDGDHGREIWISDGTVAGTHLLAESYFYSISTNPTSFTLVNGVVMFVNYLPSQGVELYRTDGTQAGTYPIEISAGSSSGYNHAGDLVSLGSVGLFSGNTSDTELWRTDGTVAGTFKLKEINASSLVSSFPQQLTVFNGVAYFRANDGVNGYELWRSDGTGAGTYMVKDINPTGDGASQQLEYTTLGGFLYFPANDGVNGVELWRTDGTAAGTTMVADISPGAASSRPTSFAGGVNQIAFSANTAANGTEFWTSDGTAAGTKLVADVNPGTDSSLPGDIVWAANSWMFVAQDATHGRELFRSFGTAATTVLVTDLNPGTADSGASGLIVSGNRIYFTATVSDLALYESDGTAGGTKVIAGSSNGFTASASKALVGDNLYFGAGTSALGSELWKYNTLDTDGPSVLSATFDPTISLQVKLQFSETLALLSLQASDLQITNLTTNTPYVPTAVAVSDIGASATFTLPATLPDGNYRFTLAAGAVSDRAGHLLAAPFELAGPTIYLLAGDLDRNRAVNFDDLLTLAQNYGQTGKTFSQGNIDYSTDGRVGFDDLLMLAQRYGTSLAIKAPAVARPRRRASDSVLA